MSGHQLFNPRNTIPPLHSAANFIRESKCRLLCAARDSHLNTGRHKGGRLITVLSVGSLWGLPLLTVCSLLVTFFTGTHQRQIAIREVKSSRKVFARLCHSAVSLDNNVPEAILQLSDVTRTGSQCPIVINLRFRVVSL